MKNPAIVFIPPDHVTCAFMLWTDNKPHSTTYDSICRNHRKTTQYPGWPKNRPRYGVLLCEWLDLDSNVLPRVNPSPCTARVLSCGHRLDTRLVRHGRAREAVRLAIRRGEG